MCYFYYIISSGHHMLAFSLNCECRRKGKRRSKNRNENTPVSFTLRTLRNGFKEGLRKACAFVYPPIGLNAGPFRTAPTRFLDQTTLNLNHHSTSCNLPFGIFFIRWYLLAVCAINFSVSQCGWRFFFFVRKRTKTIPENQRTTIKTSFSRNSRKTPPKQDFVLTQPSSQRWFRGQNSKKYGLQWSVDLCSLIRGNWEDLQMSVEKWNESQVLSCFWCSHEHLYSKWSIHTEGIYRVISVSKVRQVFFFLSWITLLLLQSFFFASSFWFGF